MWVVFHVLSIPLIIAYQFWHLFLVSRCFPVDIVDDEYCWGWPDFRDAHGLSHGCQVILGCECRWIFSAIMLDENDTEIHFAWSMPDQRLYNLHPTSSNRYTLSCS